MAEEAINMHKKNAMGISPKATGKGSMPKFAAGGGVKVPKALDSSQKQPITLGGKVKIATMKKGGSARGR
jgi:hypothetical protein